MELTPARLQNDEPVADKMPRGVFSQQHECFRFMEPGCRRDLATGVKYGARS